MAQHTISLPCIKDNYDGGTGTGTRMKFSWAIDEEGYEDFEKSSSLYMQFSPTALPPRKKLVGVRLTLLHDGTPPYELAGEWWVKLGSLRSEWPESLSTYPQDGTELGKNDANESQTVGNEITLYYKTSTNISTSSDQVNQLLQYGASLYRPGGTGPWGDYTFWFYTRESGNGPTLDIIYEDSPPLKPIPTEPNDLYINLNQEISLKWTYRSEFGGEQRAYKVEWRQQGASTWNEITETTANNYCTIPAGTLPSGNIEWRVTTYNEYNEASPVSDTLKFYGIGQPTTPYVYVESSAKPLITWDVPEQQLCYVQVLNGNNVIYDTGEQPATLWQHRVTEFLDDGEYIARVRVRNQYGFWSEWGETSFVVATTKPTAPTITVAANNDYGITVTVDCDAPKCLLYRREIGGAYKLIGEVADTYTDYNVASGVRYEFMARAVNEDNSFADSQPKTGSVTLPCSVISVDDVVLPLRNRLEAGWGRDYNRTHLRVLSQFVGRAYPVVESEGFKTQTLSLNYFLTPAELKTMQALIEAPVILYRNDMGDMFKGTIGNISYSERLRGVNRGYDVTFDIQRVGDG